MKKFTLTIFTLILFASFSAAHTNSTVYICTGPKAKVYHSVSTCRGMNRCSGDIVSVSITKAKKMGRRECKICW